MKPLFDYLERIFGIRLDSIIYFTVVGVLALMFFRMNHQVSVMATELEDVRIGMNSTSSISRADIVPITQQLTLLNDQMKRLMSQSTYVGARLPEIENALSLANEKLIFLENAKGNSADPAKK